MPNDAGFRRCDWCKHYWPSDGSHPGAVCPVCRVLVPVCDERGDLPARDSAARERLLIEEIRRCWNLLERENLDD